MNYVHTILIIGAGQIGSRHLQGLKRCVHPLRIYVVDIDPHSLRISKQRWQEAGILSHSQKTVSYHHELADCPNEIDVVIVATAAFGRVDIIAKVLNFSIVRYWILEKVLVQSPAELDRLLALFDGESSVWVNLPRRSLAWHSLIRDKLLRESLLHLKVFGESWGLACNSLHFIDMFAWFSGESLVRVVTTNLRKEWIEAKRPGNWEVMGELIAHFSGGSSATLVVLDGQKREAWYKFELHDDRFVWHIDEEGGLAVRSDGLSIPGKVPYQSSETPLLVDQILFSGQCELPTLVDSAQTHRLFLDALLSHWRETVDSAAVRVPIT